MRIRYLLATLLAFTSLPAMAAETYTLDPSHTSVWWHANHFGFSNPAGRFGITSGSVNLDEATPTDSKVEVTIDVASLATGLPKFDEHLKSADFLDAAKFPTATFKSTAITLTDKQTADVRGDFTLHGVTKPVVLKVHLNKIGEHPFTKKKTAGFSASTIIKRSEFGISQYVPNVSDDIRIDIEAEGSVQ